jgi:hypothetical protein
MIFKEEMSKLRISEVSSTSALCDSWNIQLCTPFTHKDPEENKRYQNNHGVKHQLSATGMHKVKMLTLQICIFTLVMVKFNFSRELPHCIMVYHCTMFYFPLANKVHRKKN